MRGILNRQFYPDQYQRKEREKAQLRSNLASQLQEKNSRPRVYGGSDRRLLLGTDEYVQQPSAPLQPLQPRNQPAASSRSKPKRGRKKMDIESIKDRPLVQDDDDKGWIQRSGRSYRQVEDIPSEERFKAPQERSRAVVQDRFKGPDDDRYRAPKQEVKLEKVYLIEPQRKGTHKQIRKEEKVKLPILEVTLAKRKKTEVSQSKLPFISKKEQVRSKSHMERYLKENWNRPRRFILYDFVLGIRKS